jgi:hypothetical protein
MCIEFSRVARYSEPRRFFCATTKRGGASAKTALARA